MLGSWLYDSCHLIHFWLKSPLSPFKNNIFVLLRVLGHSANQRTSSFHLLKKLLVDIILICSNFFAKGFDFIVNM